MPIQVSGNCRKFVNGWADYFADNILFKLNPFCIFAFKEHDIKNTDSRKRTSPFVTASAYCTSIDCQVTAHLEIAKETDNVVSVKFENDSVHDTAHSKSR